MGVPEYTELALYLGDVEGMKKHLEYLLTDVQYDANNQLTTKTTS